MAGGAGGGAGNYINGGGGYSAGSCESAIPEEQNKNGLASGGADHVSSGATKSSGGSYFQNGYVGSAQTTRNIGCHITGEGCAYRIYQNAFRRDCVTGNGGIGGQGGNIKVSSNAKINAYNGNECTLDETEEGYYYKPLNIYIQNGEPYNIYLHNVVEQKYINKILNSIGIENDGTYIPYNSEIGLKEYIFTKEDRLISYSATSYGQGVGSGAGYIEISNGTYVVDASLD